MSDLIALFVIVGKRAGLKFLPKIEMTQLDLRAEPDVASKQAKAGRVRQRAQAADDFPDARTRLSLAVDKNVVEPENVTLEEAPEIRGAGFNAVHREKFAHEVHVGAAGELETLGAVEDTKLGGECFGERLHTGTARVNERAINVE